ncbi:MAG TPA: S1 RNA-binding domain-containing protein [Anaerolineae bacterium]|nr:S1 RNA-binding domain-containing protein [Anaerolineae bacterium]
MAGVEGDETMSMAELLAQSEEALQQIVPGTIVKGVVASKKPGEIFIDIGAKSEGLVDPRDLDNFSPEELAAIKVGDEVSVYVIRGQTDEEEHIRLSLSQAQAERDWDKAERLHKSGDVVESEVVGYNKGGLIVSFGHVRGFVPGSQLISVNFGSQNKGDRWNKMTGTELTLKIIEVDRARNRLILSERAASDELRKEKAKEKAQFLEELSEGDVRKGKVTSLADFGAFVDIGGIDGLVHLSELSWTHVAHPSEVLRVGDEVEVYILKIEQDQQRVALSLKRLAPEPWTEVFSHYQINQIVDATITKLTNFGAFARIDNRIEGLIHISEISDKNITHPKDVLSEGAEVRVRIIHIDPDRRRMGLSLKDVDAQENWSEFQSEQGSEPDDTIDNESTEA